MRKQSNILFISAIVTAVLAACGGQDTPAGELTSLQTKRDSLKGAKDQIAEELRNLEGQIKLLDTNGNKRLPIVTAVPVKKQLFKHYFTVQGVVESDMNATVNAEVGAKILSIRANEGDKVHKGQLLMELDSKVLQNSINELKTQIELAETVYKKQKSLWDQKIGSEIQYLEAKTNKEGLEQKLATLMAQMEYYKITSPFDGILDEVFPKVGEMAAPGIPLARIVNLQNVYIKADVSENYLGKIREGDTAFINVPGVNFKISSKIERMGNFINPNNRTFKVRFDLNNKEGKLLPNMIATVDILDYRSAEKSVVIPGKLIQETPSGDKFVYLLEEGEMSSARKTLIKPGMSYMGRTEILGGLADGNMIIDQGARGIKDGEIVKVAKQQ